MSRSGYSDDYDDEGQLAMYRGQVMSAIRGKRGQAFLREMADAMDAMPIKRLISHELRQSVVNDTPWSWGEDLSPAQLRIMAPAAEVYHGVAPPLPNVCAIGTVGERRNLPLETLDPEDPETIAAAFGIAHQLVREIEYMNDEGCFGVWVDEPTTENRRYIPASPEQRWTQMRAWVASMIRGAP